MTFQDKNKGHFSNLAYRFAMLRKITVIFGRGRRSLEVAGGNVRSAEVKLLKHGKMM